jgi:hypothetical protein
MTVYDLFWLGVRNEKYAEVKNDIVKNNPKVYSEICTLKEVAKYPNLLEFAVIGVLDYFRRVYFYTPDSLTPEKLINRIHGFLELSDAKIDIPTSLMGEISQIVSRLNFKGCEIRVTIQQEVLRNFLAYTLATYKILVERAFKDEH